MNRSPRIKDVFVNQDRRSLKRSEGLGQKNVEEFPWSSSTRHRGGVTRRGRGVLGGEGHDLRKITEDTYLESKKDESRGRIGKRSMSRDREHIGLGTKFTRDKYIDQT